MIHPNVRRGSITEGLLVRTLEGREVRCAFSCRKVLVLEDKRSVHLRQNEMLVCPIFSEMLEDWLTTFHTTHSDLPAVS